MTEIELYNRLYKDHHEAWKKSDDIRFCKDKKNELMKLWEDELSPHFEEEEDVLFPSMIQNGKSAEVKELLKEHEYFYNLIEEIDNSDDCDGMVDEFCVALKKHIKNEEKLMGCFHDDPYCNNNNNNNNTKTKKKSEIETTQFEPLVSDSELLSEIEERLRPTAVEQKVSDATEEYSNFRLFGIGKRTQKQQERKDKRVAKKAVRKDKRKARKEMTKEQKKGKTFMGRLLHKIQQFNPALATVRTGVLAGLRVNIFGLSRKLYPALLSEQELKARNYNLENAQKAKAALKKAHDIYFKIGGRAATFNDAVRKGFDKPIFRTKKIKQARAMEKKSSFASESMNHSLWSVYPSAVPPYYYGKNQNNGYGIEFELNNKLDLEEEVYSNAAPAAAPAAIIVAGLGALGSIAQAIKGQVDDNPYQKGSPEYEKYQQDLITSQQEGDLDAPYDEEEMRELEKMAEEERDEFGDDTDETGGARTGDDTILGIPKTGFYIGVGVLVIALIGTGIYLAKRKK